MTNFRIDDRVVILTGACGILGKAHCRGLLNAGARVACLDVTLSGLEALAAEFDEFSGNLAAYACDISDPGAVAEAVEKIITEFGRIDALLNNAATKTDDLTAFLKPAEDYTPETWQRVMQVNLDGQFYLTQAVGRHMLENRAGSIIFVSSIYGIVGPDPSLYEGSMYNDMPISTPPAYSASKAGVIGLTRYLATSWGGRGIRVNCIVPGGVESGQNNLFTEKYENQVPLGRMAKPADMAGPVIFLLSDAAAYVNGATLVVDGGFSVW